MAVYPTVKPSARKKGSAVEGSATAEVFLLALRSLPKRQRAEVLARLLAEEDLAEDILDQAVIASRRREPSRPFEDFLREKAL